MNTEGTNLTVYIRLVLLWHPNSDCAWWQVVEVEDPFEQGSEEIWELKPGDPWYSYAAKQATENLLS